MSISFRPAEPADAPAVAELWLASRRAFLPYAPPVHGGDAVRRWIVDILVPSGGVTVAVRGQELVGMMALSHEDSVDWIDQIYVHPSATGRGIGGGLVERAKNELGALIRLYTFQANTSSRRFYERHGFRAITYSDGRDNEERCPDVLYELRRPSSAWTNDLLPCFPAHE